MSKSLNQIEQDAQTNNISVRDQLLFENYAVAGASGAVYDASSVRYSGNDYDMPNSGITAGTPGFWNGALDAMPVPIGKSHTITAVKFEVTSATASSNARIGIYTVDANGYPKNLVQDSGDISCATTGIKTWTLSTPINFVSADLIYYVCFITSISSIVVRECSTDVCLIPSVGANRGCVYRSTFAYGALPSVFPAGATVNVITVLFKFTKQ